MESYSLEKKMNQQLQTNTLVPTPHEIAVYQTMAKAAAGTPYWKKLGGEAGILSIMLMAREIDIPPMLAISGGFHNVNGSIEVSARLMNMLIRRRGHKMKIKVSQDDLCVLWGKRADTGEDAEVSYSFEDAKRAHIVKAGGGWEKFPQDMCFARAMSRLGRRLFSDCIGPFYIEGEIPDRASGDNEDRISPIPEDVKQTATHQAIEFIPPNGIDPELANQFLEESAKGKKHYTLDDLKQRAILNPEGFVEQFNKWHGSQEKEEEVLEIEATAVDNSAEEEDHPSVFSEEYAYE